MSLPADSQLSQRVQVAYESFRSKGYGCFTAQTYRQLLGDQAVSQLPEVLASFSELSRDRHMGDGGTYRFRAYSRFRLEFATGGTAMEVTPLEGTSIFQSTEDNPVNGGVLRTFEPIKPEIAEGSLVRSLIERDFTHVLSCDRSMSESPCVVGVHQVRIVARSQDLGLPTPEGIHRDRERFTFQHFMARHGIEGGEFRAYDQSRCLQFAWLQEDCLDTVMFEGDTWHSATPIAAKEPQVQGYRDIFLVDFDRL